MIWAAIQMIFDLLFTTKLFKLILKWNIKMYYETATSEQYIFLWPTLAQVISGKIPQIVQMWIAQGIQKKCVFMCVSKVLSTLKIIY